MKKKFVSTLLVLGVMSTCLLSACGSKPASESVDLTSVSLDTIEEKAKEEGTISSVGMPDDWANWKSSWESISNTYGLEHDDTDMSSAEELSMFDSEKDSPTKDIGDVGQAFGPTAIDMDVVQPYKASTWDSIPDWAKDPDGNWTTQIARNMCDMWDGFMLGKKYLIHDRDTLFHRRFDMIFESIGVKIKKLPPFTPQMNARMENFIRAIKTECLDKMIFTSQGQLRIAVREYLEYWNHYRPHEGLGGRMVMPYPQDMDAPVREVSFLGGLLHGYRRERLAA